MTTFRLGTALALAATLVAAAACAAPPQPGPPAGAGGAEAYKVGYADGCSSGFKAAAGQRGHVLGKGEAPTGGRDRLYLEGWAAGHYTCRLLAERPGWEI